MVIKRGAPLTVPGYRFQNGYLGRAVNIDQQWSNVTGGDQPATVIEPYTWKGFLSHPLRTPVLFHKGSFKSMCGLDPEADDAALANADGTFKGKFWQFGKGYGDAGSLRRVPVCALGRAGQNPNENTPDTEWLVWQACAAALQGQTGDVPLFLAATGRYPPPAPDILGGDLDSGSNYLLTPRMPHPNEDTFHPYTSFITGGDVLWFANDSTTRIQFTNMGSPGFSFEDETPVAVDAAALNASLAVRKAVAARFRRVRTVVYWMVVDLTLLVGHDFHPILWSDYPGLTDAMAQLASTLAPYNVVYKGPFITDGANPSAAIAAQLAADVKDFIGGY